MKKFVLPIIFLLLFCNAGLFAQGNEIDAFTLSNTELGGTARSMSMGGAFGALGGDLSVISNNPAGLGVYRSSEVSGTFDLSGINTSTNWSGTSTDVNKARFSPANFAFSLYFPTSSNGVHNWNFGFSYNRLKNYKRSYTMSGKGQTYSMADFAAWRAKGIRLSELTLTNNYDPYDNLDLSSDWLPILGFEAGMYDHFEGGTTDYQSAFGWGDSNGQWNIDSPTSNALRVNENGYMDEYNFGLGFNISNTVYLGVSLSVTDIDYKYSSFYEDFFVVGDAFARAGSSDYLYLENRLNTKGTAVSTNVGAILNLGVVRLGVAYNSPRYYEMTDYYSAGAGTEISGYDNPKMDNRTPEGTFSEYRFQTPDKWIFSGAIVLGKSAIISVDHELMNYNRMFYSNRNGDTDDYPSNNYIKDDYTWSHTLKLGAEVKVTPQFALRAGYMMQTSPMREQLYKNNVEVLPAGTIPHFTTASKPTNYVTVGVGYRFTPNFYMDLALVNRYNNSNAFAFSNAYANNSSVAIFSEPAKLITKTTRLALTLGYKF